MLSFLFLDVFGSFLVFVRIANPVLIISASVLTHINRDWPCGRLGKNREKEDKGKAAMFVDSVGQSDAASFALFLLPYGKARVSCRVRVFCASVLPPCWIMRPPIRVGVGPVGLLLRYHTRLLRFRESICAVASACANDSVSRVV